MGSSESSTINNTVTNSITTNFGSYAMTQQTTDCTLANVDVQSKGCPFTLENNCFDSSQTSSEQIVNEQVSATQDAASSQSAQSSLIPFVGIEDTSDTDNYQTSLTENVTNSCTTVQNQTLVIQSLKLYLGRVCIRRVKVVNLGGSQASCAMNTNGSYISDADQTSQTNQTSGGLFSGSSNDGACAELMIIAAVVVCLLIVLVLVFGLLKHHKTKKKKSGGATAEPQGTKK